MTTFPEADVIWWDADSYYVRCPLCEAVHHHGVSWNSGKLRKSHCENREYYLCCFPINDQGEVAYEIDKKLGRYINICASHGIDTENDDDVDRLGIELARTATIAAQREQTYANIYEDSKEFITIDLGHGIEPFEQKKILESISDCVRGDTNAVQDYLKTSSEARLFLRGRDSDSKTTLISAASCPSSNMLSLLIQHGAEVNTADDSGRTALMEAALFGWVDNVNVLLQHNADKSIRDGENRLAVDFAQNYYRNRVERCRRAGGDLSSSSNRRLFYYEDTFRRDIDRQEIVRLLSGENRKSQIIFGGSPKLSPSQPYYFARSRMQDSLVLYGPIENYPIDKSEKTVARLERGGKFASVAAMSGWSHGSIESLRVDGRQWTDDVFYISSVVGHGLPSHSYDQGKDGRYNACHAEKQLIAYFVDRHVFLPRDKAPDISLKDKIKTVACCLQDILLKTELGREVASLRERKHDLENELFDGDEKLIGKREEIKALERDLKNVESSLVRLIVTQQGRQILKLESQLRTLEKNLDRHTKLIDMANKPPPASLKEAAILISSQPCEDCMDFNNRVNNFFGLSIQLFAAV